MLNALGLYYEEELKENGGHQEVTSTFKRGVNQGRIMNPFYEISCLSSKRNDCPWNVCRNHEIKRCVILNDR